MKKTIALLVCMLVISIVTVQAEATTPKDDTWCPDCGIWEAIKKIVEKLKEFENRLESLERRPVVTGGGGSGFSDDDLSEYLTGEDDTFEEYETYDQYLKEDYLHKDQVEAMFRYWDEKDCKYINSYVEREDCIMQHRADRTGKVQSIGGREYVPK